MKRNVTVKSSTKSVKSSKKKAKKFDMINASLKAKMYIMNPNLAAEDTVSKMAKQANTVTKWCIRIALIGALIFIIALIIASLDGALKITFK